MAESGEPRRRGVDGRVDRPRTPLPDGVLVGGIVLLITVPVSVWCAAELGGRLSRGRWPDVDLTAAALAIRHLAARPDAVAAAWPPRARADLPSSGVFWSVWSCLVLVVLALVGTGVYRVARRRAIRRAEREAVEDYLETRRFRSARANRRWDD